MVRSRTAPQRFLACMPLLFAVQQLCEGFVWLSVINKSFSHWQTVSMYAFLLFAQVIWPLFVPFAVLFLEQDAARKKILRWFAFSGCITACYFTYCLLAFDAHIGVSPYHIQYNLDFPFAKRWFYGIIYFIPALVPTFFSGIRRMWLLGALLLASYLVSRFAYRDYIVSVWCFFGALSSTTVLFIILRLQAGNPSKG